MPGMDAQTFIERWQGVAVLPATELATAQSFVRDLCDLLGVEHPHPTERQDYEFERPITFTHGDGSTSPGRIDCYKRSAFVLEAKKLRNVPQGRAFDSALLAARAQAEAYARALPADEGRPPFLIVVDVGRVIELYCEFTRTGGTYTPFPDPRSHRIALAELAKPETLNRLRAVWTDPMSLDPTLITTRVTRHIAERLAEVAKTLEDSGHDLKEVAAFLSRCLFTMFSEDIGLLPKRSFVSLLEKYRDKPELLAQQMEQLWIAMDRGEFSALLEQTLLRFNGKLFKHHQALVLQRQQIDLLIEAARADWRQVEPAIFGTLLERALDYRERQALGAHFTPRAYVERLVRPTIVEPLREDWSHAQTAAMVLVGEGKRDAAQRLVREFLINLCRVRVLDPACGSGNFLYIALEHLKRLEGEVLDFLDQLGDTRGRLDLAGTSVDPHQLLGMEINPRAAAITEIVLWIGYLQWHYRTRGNVIPPLPVLKDFQNIECRDAVLAYDKVEAERDEKGAVLTGWDGVTTKIHPVTGLEVPDETARVPIEKYVNPRPAEWPHADFVVGNPPFIGNKRMREALGTGYVDAVRTAWPMVPESADFVMYWWENAASLARSGAIRRFGLITTNSLRQSFNRRVVERQLSAEPPLALKFAIPDHPWVDSADGAAVRIAMTSAERASSDPGGDLLVIESEAPALPNLDDTQQVTFTQSHGLLHSDLRIGANVGRAFPLKANRGMTSMGMMRAGKGFLVTKHEARDLGLGKVRGVEEHIREYRNGRDLTDYPRDLMLIDMYGLSETQVRDQFPAVYQWLLNRVKPERDQNNRQRLREQWWTFAEPRQGLRAALKGLERYIATVETAKHRVFQFLDIAIVPDHKLVALALDDAFVLGVLSSRIHVAWALASGALLEDRPVYPKTQCFDKFPFPLCSEQQRGKIAGLAERIDQHRKHRQELHAPLPLTAIYNVLEKLRAGEALSPAERTIHDQGLVSVLRELHDELDAAVFEAYGWKDLSAVLVGKCGATTPYLDKPEAQILAEEELIARIVELNAERAALENKGTVYWLRPAYQAKGAQEASKQETLDVGAGEETVQAKGDKVPWPKEAPAQAKAVADILMNSPGSLSLEELASRFTGRGRWRERLGPMLEMLVVLGKARAVEQAGRKRYLTVQ